MPLAVPYATNDSEFARVDGELEHQGQFYRLVKQRLSMDTLYLVCVKDTKTMKIRQALTDYVKTFTDKPLDAKSPASTFSTFIKDFMTTTISVQSGSSGWELSVGPSSVAVSLTDFSRSISSPPPRG